MNLSKFTDREIDVMMAINIHGWRWDTSLPDHPMLVPPPGDKRLMWAANWDEYGRPHWLPHYTKERGRATCESILYELNADVPRSKKL